jgi:hypothetical protein
MPRRRTAVLLAACALAAPAAARAQEPVGPTGGTAAPGGEVGLRTTPGMLVGAIAGLHGQADVSDAGRIVTVERYDAATASWLPLATTTIGLDGAYLARWRPDVAGVMRTRATIDRGAGAAASAASPEVSMIVYRPARATWYGPGFFGRRTACGVKLTRRLLGVAHRRLRCGTPVAISYRGRSITVPVVDRGPFKRGRTWDLTAATAAALGFTVTARIGALPLPPPGQPASR